MDTSNEVCVCAADFFETAEGTIDNPPVCTACPPGSTTNHKTNSDECSKIIISRYYIFFPMNYIQPIYYICSLCRKLLSDI